MLKLRGLSYVLVAVLAAGAGAGVAWVTHPDGIQKRPFHGVVLNVDSYQAAIGVQLDDGTKIGGLLANDGPPLKPGQSVDGVFYPESVDTGILRVDGPN